MSGAIAQLGERLLCKQEVVGSIPSGSTTGSEPGGERLRPSKQFSDPAGSVGVFDIVKKGFVWPPRQEGAAALRGRQGLTALPIRQILHKNWSFLSMTSATGLPSYGRVQSGWALIMRAIKRLKGIWWMPWR